jgi:hypothetical protein
MSCISSTSIQNQVINDLTQSAKQQAEAINQQFGLLTFAEAISISSSYLTLANQMNTAFYNSCVTEISNNNVSVISCGGSTNMSVDINYDSTIQNTQNCVFNNSSVTNTANDIAQSISQVSRAKISNFLATIFFAIALVIIASAIFLFLILLIMKAGKKQDMQIATTPEKETTDKGEDVIALAAELTGRSPSQMASAVPSTNTVAYNPMSFLIK